LRFGALLPFIDIEFDFLPFAKGAMSVLMDGSIVYKNFASVFSFDEPKSL
jgi:hypothetical protein